MWCRVIRCLAAFILLIAVCAVRVSVGSHVAAAASAGRGERVFIPGVGDLDLAQAEALAAQIHDGPHQLTLQRAAARREGILRTPQQLQAPLPPPERNAAPIYTRLTRLLKEKPLDPATDKVRGSVGVRVAHTPAEIERVRKLLAERRDVTALIHQAAGKPDCVFQREWSRGKTPAFPEFSPMREGVRLLTAESYFLARAGHYRGAVANQGQAFRVAGHAVNETVVIPQLVGMALDSITLSGMESILALAGPNAEVAEAVRKTITEQRPRFRMRDALEGEWALISRGMQRLGEGDPEAARQLGLPGDSAAEQAQKVTPADQRRVRREAADCIEAYTLSQVRTLIASCDQPYPARRPLLQRLLTLDKRPASNPMQRMGNMILPTLAQVATKEVAAHAQKEAVIAGAALLAYKARRGAFPDRLEQAFPQPPPDPFSGRPLKFRREGSGFVVYSIGPDGNFDGKPEAKRNPEHAYFRYPATPQPPPRG